jgi:proteasome alpha subunit
VYDLDAVDPRWARVNQNNQQAYDRGTSLYSPDGRIYQVEYAREAVKRGAASVGIRAADGVVLAALSRTGSDLMEVESVEKLHKLDDHVGAASAGHVADARKLIDFARRYTQQNRLRYGEAVGIEALAKRITDMVQESTQSGGIRPFGASLLLAGMDDDGPRLFETDPSGTPHEWRAVAIGGGRAEVLELLEEEWSSELTVDDAVELAVRALALTDDDIKVSSVSLAVVDADGYRQLDADRVADVASAAGLGDAER